MSLVQTRVAGHFGELLQGRIGADGPVALVTLPCPALGVWGRVNAAVAMRLHGTGQRLLTPARARALLARLGLPLPGRVLLRAEMPVGGGAGASTAALVTLARLAGWRGSAQELARACVAVEGASDPLMFPRPERLLWASRRAETLAHLPALPQFEVIGGFYGPPKRTDPADSDFPDITDLVSDWQVAAQAQDLPTLAALASVSARRTLAACAAQTDPTASLAVDLGALGYVIAHTGAARGLIFAPGQVPDAARGALRRAGMRGLVQFRAGGEA